MKCKTCNGLGRTKATEFIGVDEGLRDVVILCPTCGGKGEVEQTNDEWRKTCSTEEFAKLMSDAMWYGEQCATEGVLCENCKCPWCKTDSISEWLKQPHREGK